MSHIGLPSPDTSILGGNVVKPTATHFLAPLLVALAGRTQYRPLVFVTMNEPRPGTYCKLRNTVLDLCGYNPKDPASMPFPLWGTANPSGMYRRVWYAMRNNSRDYLVKRPRKDALPLFVTRKKGRKTDGWALTEAGVAVAASLRDLFIQDGKNVTSIWLDGQFATGMYDKLINTLSQDPHLSKEAATQAIRGHIHRYVISVVRKDTFKPWLMKGDAPRFNQLCDWIKRRAISSFRKASRDALLRQSRGARTAKERAEGAITTAAVVASDYREVVQDRDDLNPHESRSAIVDTTSTDAALHILSWQQGLDRVRDAVLRQRSRAGDRYGRLFDDLCDGTSVREIAKREDISENRAGNLRAGTRAAIKDAIQMATDARSVLTYIGDEPFSTRDDIEEDLEIKSNLTILLRELVANRRLIDQGGSYRITARGRMLLREHDLADNHTIEGLAAQVSL